MTASSSALLSGFRHRIAILGLLLAIEWLPLANFVYKGLGLAPLFQVSLAVASLFAILGYVNVKDSDSWRSLVQLERAPLRWDLLAWHLLAFAVFASLSFHSFGNNLALTVAWVVAAPFVIALAIFAFVPWKTVIPVMRGAGYAWLWALLGGLAAWRLGSVFRLWNETILRPVTDLTFSLVKVLLSVFRADIIADRAAMTIGSPGFNVTISPLCSGVEGTALMMVFTVAWLAVFRREFRFPLALLLAPAAMMTIWVSNAVRITALVLIGIAGAPTVAITGFHTQAGWIAFNGVAVIFMFTAGRIPWFVKTAPVRIRSGDNATIGYLAPFLAILAAGMISRAFSADFEWLYPLRFIAGAVALWVCRARYRDLQWSFGWYAPALGGFVFLIWIAADRLLGTSTNSPIAAGFAAATVMERSVWVVVRAAAAVITVPIAEELAFRAFLIRRLVTPDFTSLGTREFTAVSVALSSLAFGLLHGDRWLAGTVAGLIYAAAFLRRGRIGDAVVAHATTNALLAGWVLLQGAWQLW